MNNKDTVVSREEIMKGTEPKEDVVREVLEIETHHDHKIIRDEDGRLRWQEDHNISELIGRDRLNLNDLVPLLHLLGHGKNSETMRRMYRCMGYSLFGYWEIFHWEANNAIAHEYEPNKIK